MKIKVHSAVLILLLLCTILSGKTLDLPARKSDALSGTQLLDLLKTMSAEQRDQEIYRQILDGNVPSFLRVFVPVTINQSVAGQSYELILDVLPDYFALGSDQDYFMMPMTPLLGQKIADLTGCSLPTRKLVDEIWSAASVKMSPQPIAPSAEMVTIPVFYDHHLMVYAKRQETSVEFPLGALVSGNKKDVVLANKWYDYTDYARVLIYGWHYTSGSPIQPLSGVHEESYVDYSHGLRLIHLQGKLNGTPCILTDIMGDSEKYPLVSDESGPLLFQRYPVAFEYHFPLEDLFPQDGPELLNWQYTYTNSEVIAFSPVSNGGDGFVLQVMDTSGGVESSCVGNASDQNYFVECQVYCRKPSSGTGFERMGIFLRDQGSGVFEHSYLSGGGNCYWMAFDSDTGRLWCAKTVDGTITDFPAEALYLSQGGWHTFRIEAIGDYLTFLADGESKCFVKDSSFSFGKCGIAYHEYLDDNSDIQGTLADHFRADSISTAVNAARWQLLK